jgi:hypothetical protein
MTYWPPASRRLRAGRRLQGVADGGDLAVHTQHIGAELRSALTTVPPRIRIVAMRISGVAEKRT